MEFKYHFFLFLIPFFLLLLFLFRRQGRLKGETLRHPSVSGGESRRISGAVSGKTLELNVSSTFTGKILDVKYNDVSQLSVDEAGFVSLEMAIKEQSPKNRESMTL